MASSTKAAAPVPDWITKEFFVDVITTKLARPDSEFQIIDLNVKPATESGDNYASVLYRVQVTVEVQGSPVTVPLIVKALPKFGIADELIQSMNLFPRETGMYGQVLPALEKLYADRGRPVTFGPRCLKLCSEPTAVIVLEDLRERDFRMANRRQGLDMEHSRMMLGRLAQFHAASAVYCEQNGPYDDKFQEATFAEKGRAMHEQFQKLQSDFMYMIFSNWSDRGKYFAEIMKHWGMDMFDVMVRRMRASAHRFNVLNHGDAWCNNILFHYDENKALDEIALIDFQLSFWCTPAVDLLYFMFTSVNGEERFPQMDTLLHCYHENLVRELTFLGYCGEIPTLSQLHSDVITHHMYAFIISFSILPICLLEKTDDASMDLMMDAGDAGIQFKLKLYNNPAFVKQMEQIMEFFYNMGTFDILQLGTQAPLDVECDASVQLPLWLSKDFITDIVASKFGEPIGERRIIRSIYTKAATEKNSNTAPALYAVKVNLLRQDAGTEETVSLIVKAPPKGHLAAYERNRNNYVREQQVYELLLPAFEQFYRDKGEPVVLGARYHKPGVVLPVSVVVLEDLSASGYRKVFNRQDGLDKQHTEVVLDQLAKFHAASAVYRAAGGQLPRELTEGCCVLELAQVTDERFSPAVTTLLNEMQDWDFAAEYVEKLEVAFGHVCSSLLDTSTIDAKTFTVLNHGKASLNDMLFTYEGSEVKRVAFIDYQHAAWGSPAFDLVQLLFSSVHLDLKLSDQAYFLRFYQERLVRNLRLLRYPKPLPTLQQLHIDFNERLFAAVKTVLIDLPILLAEPALEVANAPAGVEAKEQADPQEENPEASSNSRYKQHMTQLLPYLRNRGLLNN
ncbi:uncharacterized protein LOC118457762 [Anopheles albimanus]|uniref:uncharacterized protein LOC118457762 n=1 Tax=Anopheles albimanus TaxID=7167 RepID=UPI001640FF90|nr:uncharacterized protein LOC118457762 [Anopheles albimanus]